MAIRVQTEDFDLGVELAAMRSGRTDIGAIVSFTGLVRDIAGAENVSSLDLEHYPGMTQKALEAIDAEARQRWSLNDALIIHRYGRMMPGEQIMMVATASKHRQAAFESAEFLMDFLKSRAPFWKREHGPQGARWIDARDHDEAALKRWQTRA